MEPPFGVPDEDYFKYEGFNYVHSYAVAGLPSTVVPIAEQEGMPLGVQVVASAYQEHVSLAVAAKLESMLGGFVPRMLSR
jgi:amidase